MGIIKKSKEDTKRKILRVARDLFIKQGFAGTSMGNLALQAGVTHSLIFHHFRTKEELWKAVKSDIISDAKVDPLNEKPESLKKFLKEAIAQRLKIYESNPQLLKLISWQRLEQSRNKKVAYDSSQNPSTPLQWLIPIKYLQSIKLINPQLKPEFVMLWLVNSINGVVLDELGYFAKQPGNCELYIQMISQGLEKGLGV